MFNEMMPMSLGGGGVNKIAIGTLQYNDPRWTGSGAYSECPIEVGFQPTHIIWYFESNGSSPYPFMSIYNAELKNDKFFGSTLIQASSGNNWQWIENGRKSGQNPWFLGLQTVDSNGFTIGYKDYENWSSYTLKWIALQINE